MANKTNTLPNHIKQLLEQVGEEKILQIKEFLNQMYQIWNLVGIDEEQQLQRASVAWNYIYDLCKDLLNEEKGFYEDIKERVKNYEQKISELSTELDMELLQVDGTLIVKEEILRKELDRLTKLKHKRIKEFQELHSLELKYCRLLGMPPLNLSSTTGVPSEKDLHELGQQIDMLKEEKEVRLKRFQSLKKELTTILEVTELPPESPLEKDLLYSKECPSLSSDTFKILNEIVAKTKSKQQQLENEKAELTEKLKSLWERLNISNSERENFMSRYNDCRISSINALKNEISRCEEIKRQNIKVWVDASKKELENIWERCYVCGADRRFPDSGGNEVDEELLKKFDHEVDKWKEYYKRVQHIVEKIEKRKKLWDLMLIFEKKAEDPNRFHNRGGNLLKEERERKKLQKELPALETEIFQDINDYEEANRKPFLYFGEDFRVIVTQEWEDRQAQKENMKKEKQKQRTKQIENEITLGTTTSKRAFPSTPKSAPSKLFKSTLGVPIYRTPGRPPSRPMPNTVSKMKTTKQPETKNAASASGVLKEKNQNPSVSSATGLLHDNTTYSGFASKLNSSSRKAHRSSVLSSRKIVGTRMSNSRRKSANKSSSKISARKNNSKMVTPARGKLGMPFLI